MVKLFYGEEPYLIESEIRKAKNGLTDLNIHEYAELGPEVFEQAIHYPFFSERQVILVRPEKLNVCENLISYIKKPTEFTDLLIVPRVIDKRTTTFQALKKAGLVVECNKVTETILQKFILGMIKKEGCKIKEDNYKYFIERCGYLNDSEVTLYVIETYIRQLCVDVVSGEITRDSIDTFVKKSLLQSTFDLTRVLLSRNAEKLYEMATKFIEDGESPIGMLSLILRVFRIAYKGALYGDESPQEIGKMVGVPFYQIKDAMKYNPKCVSLALDILQKGVNDIKNGRAPGNVIYYKSLSEVLTILTRGVKLDAK